MLHSDLFPFQGQMLSGIDPKGLEGVITSFFEIETDLEPQTDRISLSRGDVGVSRKLGKCLWNEQVAIEL